jgi:hypothetical protein
LIYHHPQPKQCHAAHSQQRAPYIACFDKRWLPQHFWPLFGTRIHIFPYRHSQFALTLTRLLLLIQLEYLSQNETDHPGNLGWECVQGVRHGFEGRNGKNRGHLVGDKVFPV